MPKYRDVVLNRRGDAITGATVTVYLEGTSTKASLFTDAALSVSKDNPVTTNAWGEFDFYIASGTYDLSVEKSGTLGIVNVFSVQIGAFPDDGLLFEETPDGDLDGVNKEFTLTHEPDTGSLNLFINGMLQKQGVLVSDPLPSGFILSGTTITLTDDNFAPDEGVGDWMRAVYRRV